MKSFLIILFSLNLCTGGALFGEIARMPALAEHFKVHQQENSDTTLAQFLWLHYIDNYHTSNPNHDHHSLPFHHHHCGQISGSIVDILPIPDTELESGIPLSELVSASDNFYYTHYLPVGFTGSVFQPPKA